MKNREKIIRYSIYIVSIIGLTICVAVLFPQVRHKIIESAEQTMHRKTSLYEDWFKILLSYAIGGILFIVLFDYCTLTASGKMLVRTVKYEIKECLAEIDRRSLVNPVLIMSGIYLLGIISLLRANFLYRDDITRSAWGDSGGWYDWSRYVSEFSAIFIHGDFHLTDISPLPQLLAILISAAGSVLLVYILNNGKIKIPSLLASVPLGLSPYMLECLSYRFDAPYITLSVLASIVPFLFYTRKKAFIFCSVICLLIMSMTYQASSGIYILITLILGFNDWNSKRKNNREVILFLGRAVLSFCLAMAIFKFFLMRPFNTYVSNAIFPVPQLISGVLTNIKTYINTINDDFGYIWKALIGLIFCFFIGKSIYQSKRNKMVSFITATLFLSLLFILSYGVYLALEHPLFEPRALYGFGALLAIIGIFVVYKFNNTARVFVFALSWSFLVFALSYGNALADQIRYGNFRTTVLLHDLSALYPDKDENKISIQLKNKIGFAPVVNNIGKRNPVIYRLIPGILTDDDIIFSIFYMFEYFNYAPFNTANLVINSSHIDYSTLDLPIVLKTYYHTIKSDGKRVLVELNKGIK